MNKLANRPQAPEFAGPLHGAGSRLRQGASVGEMVASGHGNVGLPLRVHPAEMAGTGVPTVGREDEVHTDYPPTPRHPVTIV